MKRVVTLLCSAPLALGLLGSLGCGDDCNTAIDCAAGEVCLIGICTPAEAQYRNCASDSECNQGAQTELFECVAGRCLVSNVAAPPPPVDAGMDAGPDGGPDASMDGGPDGGPDASMDGGPDGGPDAGSDSGS